MGIFNRHDKAAKRTDNTGWNPLAQALQRIWTMPPKRDAAEMPDLFHKSPRLAPVGAIARAVASTEYQLFDKIDYRKNGEAATPILDHEVLDLLENPIRRYPEIDNYAMFYMTNALCKLVGEAYWLKVRSDSGKVMELDIIPPAWVMGIPTISNPNFLVYPYGSTSSRALSVPASDMVVFKRSNLVDPYGRGRGDSEPLADELQTDEQLAKLQGLFAYNDATPKIVITAPGITEENAAAFKTSWMQKIGGKLNHGVPAVIPNDIKVEKLSMSPVELDMMESRKFIRDMSSEHYQIPPEILGRIENSNRATINSAFYLYNKNVLSYEYSFIERTLTRQLIVPDFDKNIIFKFNPDIPEDEEHKLAVMNAGLSGGTVMVDEWRKSFDLPELPNGKGKVFLRAMSVFEVPANGTAPEPPKPEGEKEPIPEENTEESPEKMFIRITDDEPIRIVEKSEKESRLDAIWKTFDARATAHEGEFSEAVKRFAKIQEKLVLDALDVKSINEPSGDEKTLSNSIDKALETVFNDASNKALKSALAPAWLSTLADGREHTLEMIGKKKAIKADIDPSFEVFNEMANDWVEQFGLMKAVEINTTTYSTLRKNIQEQIIEALAKGETGKQIQKRILEVCDSVYDMMSKSRAEKIARTESCSSVNAGSYIQALNEGMKKKQFLATRDDRTRDAHAGADGQIVNILDPFIVDSEEMQYPGDPNCSAGNVVNCRCSFLLSGPGVEF